MTLVALCVVSILVGSDLYHYAAILVFICHYIEIWTSYIGRCSVGWLAHCQQFWQTVGTECWKRTKNFCSVWDIEGKIFSKDKNNMINDWQFLDAGSKLEMQWFVFIRDDEEGWINQDYIVHLMTHVLHSDSNLIWDETLGTINWV